MDEPLGQIKDLHFTRVSLPLKTPFSTALGRKEFINNVLVTVILDDGRDGTGEIPTSFTVPHETVPVIEGVLKEIAGEVKGLPAAGAEDIVRELRRRFPRARLTVSGLEVALFRAVLKGEGTEFAYWGASRHVVESDITVPFTGDTDELNRWVRQQANSGFRIFKLKISGDPSRDLAFVCAVHSLLEDAAPSCRLRLDGNQGFTADSVLLFMDRLLRKGIFPELIEQPLPREDIAGHAFVRERIPVPVILDESVFSLESLSRAIENNACDGVNIKVAKSGILESRRIINAARREGLRLMAGCMTETMTGLSCAIAMACGSGAFDFVDLDSIYFLETVEPYGDIRVETPYFRI